MQTGAMVKKFLVIGFFFLFTSGLLAGQNKAFRRWVSGDGKKIKAPDLAVVQLGGDQLRHIAETEELPYNKPTLGVRKLHSDTLWLGSEQGVMMGKLGGSWRYFQAQRWLDDNHVVKMELLPNGARVTTETGVRVIHTIPMTFEKKAAFYDRQLQKYNTRLGFVGDARIKIPGDLSSGTFKPHSDNDGLWTSLYIGAECFRYAVTGDPEAKKNARKSLESLMWLERVNGIPGFISRSIVPAGEPERLHYGGEWHLTRDGKWEWKGDTSSDEVDGHYFAYAVYYDLAATPKEKKEIRAYVKRITDYIVDHNYYLLDLDGKPTTWGFWGPQELNEKLNRLAERGLNSLEILSHLKVAYHITGGQKYQKCYRELIEKHGYAMNTVRQKLIWPHSIINHSDDELAFVPYYHLLQYETDPELVAIYLSSIQRSWEIERPEISPFFDYVYAASIFKHPNDWKNVFEDYPKPDGHYDAEKCVAWFKDVPLDLIDWTMDNTHRTDYKEKFRDRHGRISECEKVFPVSERPLMRWNGDPYRLRGGDGGRTLRDGTFWLLPYWMGRYHKLLKD